jgi:hypothetical protein
MITISKPKAITVIIMLLLFLGPVVNIGHALYTVSLPSNTMYADDFENYTQGQDLASSSGWSQLDADTGGYSHVNNTNYLSCCKSLQLRDSSLANGKWDIDRRLGRISNITQIVTVSIWFAFTTSINTNGGSTQDFHIAIESWDRYQGSNQHTECLTFFYASATVDSGVYPDFVTDSVGELIQVNYRATAFDTASTATRGYWHHYTISCDIVHHKWVSAQLDGFDFTTAVVGQSAHVPSADTSFQTYQITNNLRVELAVQNQATHTVPFYVWFDNMVVSDTTPGQPNIISFGIVAASGLFQLILITTAMMYVSSGFGAVMRVFAKEKVPKFLGPKFIIITGVVGTAGFLFMLIVGANLVAPACPPGSICTG